MKLPTPAFHNGDTSSPGCFDLERKTKETETEEANRKTRKEIRESPAAASSSSDTEDVLIAHEESPEPPLAYVPPAGSVPADFDVDFGEFDYDAVKEDEGAELWLVRAPTAVKAKNLHGIQVLASSNVTGRVGELSRKTTAYDIWSQSPSSSRPSDDSQRHHVCAEELHGLSVLLPRKRKGGKLFLAPKPVTRHLVVTARPAEPARSAPGDALSNPATFENPPREAYPDEVLTHRFRPYGDPGDPPPPPPETQMDDHGHAERDAKEKEKEKRKKRRGEATGSPKKLKKAKTAAS
ncbi:hypothetical protein EI94DRAFT_1687806 [Lactarius quietus]|nr:hypothetical protein EI94DRAFT_1687806 [Lactarius quietus]